MWWSGFRWRFRPPRPIAAISSPSARRWGTSSPRCRTEMAGPAPRAPDRVGARAGRRRTRFAVVAARFHEAISKKLVDGRGGGGDGGEAPWVRAPFELPRAALPLARSRRYAGIACVGVVIRGGTPHFEHISRETARGIRQGALG